MRTVSEQQEQSCTQHHSAPNVPEHKAPSHEEKKQQVYTTHEKQSHALMDMKNLDVPTYMRQKADSHHSDK